MLDQVAGSYPALVKETIPKSVSLFQLTDIARRLGRGHLGARFADDLADACGVGAGRGDNVTLTEQVRWRCDALSLTEPLAARIPGRLLGTTFEDTVRSSIQHTQRLFLALSPRLLRRFGGAAQRARAARTDEPATGPLHSARHPAVCVSWLS